MRRRFMNTNSVADINYMGIEALEDEFSVSFTNLIYYKIDDGEWSLLLSGESTPFINKGSIIYFKGELLPNISEGIGQFEITQECNLVGNCMSLLYGDKINNPYLPMKAYSFIRLFKNCYNIINIEDTFLPATTLDKDCYSYMFSGCTGLTQAPELPATTLAYYCYSSMFSGCTGLTQAPELPATTLADCCYSSMFSGCTGLTQAPELPATTLADDCYSYMFSGCTGLTQAPELPATTLAYYCYSSMFSGCTNLSYIKMLATDISASNCLSYWVQDVASTGTFIKSKDATWDTTPGALGTSGVPAGWTVITE